jgi:hypothetical protein
MPGIADVVIKKGRLFSGADADLEVPTQELYDLLKAAGRLSQRGIDAGALEESDREHVEVVTLGEELREDDEKERKPWWPGIRLKEEIVRAGYLEAINISLKSQIPLPIVSYWVSGPETFEVVIAQSDHQITVFFITPKHDTRRVPRTQTATARTERLWVVAPKQRIDAIKASFPEGYGMNDLDKPTEVDEIRCLQLKGY